MPNGNPDFNVKELERFFSALAAVLEGFAQRHNLRLEKYYHQAPSWGFLFRHPSGGVGKIEVQRVSEATVCILSDWWYDDFDAATRGAPPCWTQAARSSFRGFHGERLGAFLTARKAAE